VSLEKIQPVIGWVARQGRLEKSRTRFIERLASEIRAAALPVERITTGVPILHPQVNASSVVWELGAAASERSWLMEPEHYRMRANSPLHAAYFEGQSSHCPIGPEKLEGEFGIVDDLRQEGFTDYLCLPVLFSDGSYKAMTFATRAPSGFADSDVQALEALVDHLGVVLELQASEARAETLLSAYLGEETGRRVLSGQIRRGMADEIHAVIWFSDLRGSTPLAQTMSADDFLGLLNRYLECMALAVLDQGGEVLRFIGDAALGIFPIDPDHSTKDACRRALTAALDSIARMDAINAERSAANQAPVEFGVGLHLGDVLYGNIGAQYRLEFTVIGHAANQAARIEGQCKNLGERLLFSAEVAHQLGERAVSLGAHALKGVGSPQELFTVPAARAPRTQP
jgi:adenylate cyclase